MHKNFGEWYRLVAIEPDGDKLKMRWAGVEAWVKALRKSDKRVLETVRIFRGLPANASRDPFLEVFRKIDPAFPQRNDLELQVLAGASLVKCVQAVGRTDAGQRTAVLAGTALEASSLLGGMESGLDEIAREVSDGLRVISVEQRKRSSIYTNTAREKANAVTEGLEEKIEEISGINKWEVLHEVVTPIFQELVDAVRAADTELRNAAHNLRSVDEETSILWWLEGGCSRDMNEPWGTLKNAAAIIAGTELADLTDVALGPRDATALLECVLTQAKGEGKNEVPLADYVNALPDNWVLERTAKLDETTLGLAPIALATFHRAKSGAPSWQQNFDSSSGLKSSIPLTAACVARQAYVEAILLRTLADT